tara:strand:+ start:59 stop:766 length:708 start_codon:yes stop_codon:yes gene_type:complete
MLIHCKYCQSKFAINAEEVGFDGRLVKCENCQKEWFQESKSKSLEKKLIELDRNLLATEQRLTEQKNNHNDKILKLEKSLKAKKEELDKQKLLEDRIGLFEKRIVDTEKEIEEQALIENRISQLENEIKKNSHDSFIKNTALEKKTNDLQIKIQSDNASDKLDNLEKDFVINEETKVSNEETKVSNEETKENKDNTTLPEEDSYSSNIRNISPKDWDLSEETLERELNTIKKNKL